MPAILALGFILGMRHAADPDHVIAVTTVVTRDRTMKAATLIGAAWGLGHTLTILIVGGGIILLRWAIPERVGLSMEFAVALMLIGLGLTTLRDVLRARRHLQRGRTDRHQHTHSSGHLVTGHPRTRPYQLVRPLIVGVVHGLAGSAAVALLVIPAIDDPRWSVLYLTIFGVGTIVGMMLITAGLAVPFARGIGESPVAAARLRMASGMVSVAFGCFLAWHVGVVEGLLTGAAIR